MLDTFAKIERKMKNIIKKKENKEIQKCNDFI